MRMTEIGAFHWRLTILCCCVVLMCCQATWATDASSAVADSSPEPPAERFDPVVKEIEGWTVHVDPALLDGEHAEVGSRALAMLGNHLQRIAVLLPPDRLEKLQQMELWIEHSHPTLGAMQYHPDRKWLEDHGHDPRLAKKVHITRAEQLLSRAQMLKHPAVILHELAHAYHDQALGFDDPRLIKLYKKAMDAGLYDRVLLYNGQRVRHYAATDHKEYFAEGTEAFLYRNDFYPFVAAELAEHDSDLYKLLEEIWGPLHKSAPKADNRRDGSEATASE